MLRKTLFTSILALLIVLNLNSCTTYSGGGMFDDIRGTGNLWRTLAYGMDMPLPDNDRVREQIVHLTSQPRLLTKIQRNARPYLYEIITKLKKNDLPLELALIPAIESLYKPQATSRSNAAGLWQFIESTGDIYGLTQNIYQDKRRDPILSTDAALRYFKHLEKFFDGDWELAIASYNGGEGTISRAVAYNLRKGKKGDFWSLTLRKETADYVPRLFALVKIIKNPQRYGLRLRPIPYTKVLASVSTTDEISIAEAARESDLSVSEMINLNARYTYGITQPGVNNSIFVPKNRVAQVIAAIEKQDNANNLSPLLAGNKQALTAANLPPLPSPKLKQLIKEANLSSNKRIRYKTHTVKRGETLSAISNKHRVSVAKIKAANNLANLHLLRVGQRLKIPKGKYSPRKKTLTKRRYYTVKRGDTLSTIAQRHKMTTAKLKKINKLKSNKIKAGQKLRVGTKKVQVASRKRTRIRRHSVRSGESLYSISRRYGTTISALKQLNGLKSDALRPGQKLKVSKATKVIARTGSSKTTKSSKSKGTTYHRVSSGETLYSISRKHGVSIDHLKKLNRLKSDALRIGQKLKLPAKS